MKTKKIFLDKKISHQEKVKIRKKFLKLRNKGISYVQCKKMFKITYNYDVSIRTLQRWNKKFKETNWNLKDYSRKPKTIHYKVSPEIKKRIVFIGNKTGWGEYKIANLFPDISHTTINKVLRKHNLIKSQKLKE